MAAPMEDENLDIPANIQAILLDNPCLKVIGSGKKIKCSLSGHEMPCRLDAVNTYISGKKYKKLQEKIGSTFDWEKFKEHLVPSNKKRHEHQLFCKLTWRHLNKQPHHILRHIQGRRFQRALTKWEECQKSGEVFKPRGGQRHKKTESDMEVEETGSMASWEGGNESEPDCLADLYPDADFKEDSVSGEEEEAGESLDEAQNMETEDKDTNLQLSASSDDKKRKYHNPGKSGRKKQKLRKEFQGKGK